MAEPVQEWFAHLMVTLAECYGASPSAKLTEERIRLYERGLSDLTQQQVRDASLSAVKELKWFPTIAELRAYAVPSPEDAALIAWSGLERAAGRVGAYASLQIDDRAIATALMETFGGWPEFCLTQDGPALALKRQEFLAAYRQARRLRKRAESAVRVPGLLEARSRYTASQHVYVGRLAANGEVTSERARPGLPAGKQRLELGEGVANAKETIEAE